MFEEQTSAHANKNVTLPYDFAFVKSLYAENKTSLIQVLMKPSEVALRKLWKIMMKSTNGETENSSSEKVQKVKSKKRIKSDESEQ